MPTAFPPPVNVSPLIRFGRYSLLLAGIGYGAFWQSRYTKKEIALKDVKAKEKAARDARLAQEKELKNAAHVENEHKFEFLEKLDTSDIDVPKTPFTRDSDSVSPYEDLLQNDIPGLGVKKVIKTSKASGSQEESVQRNNVPGLLSEVFEKADDQSLGLGPEAKTNNDMLDIFPDIIIRD